MSKKTRKKSSKVPTKKASVATSRTPAKKLTTPAGPGIAKKAKKVSVPASHKVPSKSLKAATKAKTVVAKPVASKPLVAKVAPEVPKVKKTPLKAAPKPASNAPASEGAPAPKFKLPRDGGANVSLADYAGKKLVIFFYPRADTPGCTKEAIDFTRLSPAFAECGTAILGVSADPLKAQESFRDKHELAMPLISDETHEMLEAYGAWGEKSMYGRTFQGVLRTTVLIGKNGKVAKIWRGVKVDGHADEVLGAAQAL